MSIIHQLYATHCTYGTSAIERRTTGDSKDRVLGYSARASSFTQSDLRRHFRTIERFLYYYLPKETPPDKKQKLTPQDAPHRMFFCPSLTGLQAVGYISYRPTDRAGRVGSYFAHVLASEIKPAETPWDVIECLKLWNASGWMIEDTPGLSYDLPPAKNLAALRNGRPAAVDERVLWSFLNTPPEPRGKFYTPDPTVIPKRWREMSVEERRKQFRQAVMGYLEIADQPRESLLLLAEPAVAVLFFYGIARLLPPPLRTALSFSTFEANADRLVTSLAAFTFDNELVGGDVSPERYRRGFVVNTWQDKASTLRAPQAKYADFVLASLVGVPEKDVQSLAHAIDGKLAHFQGCELKRTSDLEDVVQANTLCEQVLRLTPGVDHAAWNNKPAQKVFIRKAVRQKLAGPSDAAYLDQVLRSEEYLPLMLEIAVQGEGDDNCTTSVAYLVERIPLDRLDKLLGPGDVARGYKLHALRHYVAKQNQLPKDCDWFWTERTAAGKPPVAFDLFQSSCVTIPLIKSQLDAVPGAGLNLLFRSVLRAPIDAGEKREILGRIAARSAFDVAALMPELQSEVSMQAAMLKAVLLPSLRQALNQLHQKPASFGGSVGGIEAAVPLLEGESVARVKAWGELKRTFEAAQREKQNQAGGRIKKGKSDEFTKKVIWCLDRCFSRHDPDCEEMRSNSTSQGEIKTFVEALARECSVADLLTKTWFQDLSKTFRGIAATGVSSRASAAVKKPQQPAGPSWLEEHWTAVKRLVGAAILLALLGAVIAMGIKLSKLYFGRTGVAGGPGGASVTPTDEDGKITPAGGSGESGKEPDKLRKPAGSATQSPPLDGRSPGAAKKSQESSAKPTQDSKPAAPPKPVIPPYPVAELPGRDVVVEPGMEHHFELVTIDERVKDFTVHLHGSEVMKGLSVDKKGDITDTTQKMTSPTELLITVKTASGTASGEEPIAEISVRQDRLVELRTNANRAVAEAQKQLRFCVLEIREKKTGVPRYIALQKPRQVPEGFEFGRPDLTKMRCEAALKLEPSDAPPGETKFCLGEGRLSLPDGESPFGVGAPTQKPSDIWPLADFMQKKGLSGFGPTVLKSVNIVCSQGGAESLVLAVETEPEFVPDPKFKEVSDKLAKLEEWKDRLPDSSAVLERAKSLKPSKPMSEPEKEIAAYMMFLEEQGRTTPDQKLKWAQEAAAVLGKTLPDSDPTKGAFATWVVRGLHRGAVDARRTGLQTELDKLGDSEKAKLQRSLKMALESLTSVNADVYRIVEVPNRKKDGKGTVPVRVLIIGE